jgi:hypothetical protein
VPTCSPSSSYQLPTPSFLWSGLHRRLLYYCYEALALLNWQSLTFTGKPHPRCSTRLSIKYTLEQSRPSARSSTASQRLHQHMYCLTLPVEADDWEHWEACLRARASCAGEPLSPCRPIAAGLTSTRAPLQRPHTKHSTSSISPRPLAHHVSPVPTLVYHPITVATTTTTLPSAVK